MRDFLSWIFARNGTFLISVSCYPRKIIEDLQRTVVQSTYTVHCDCKLDKVKRSGLNGMINILQWYKKYIISIGWPWFACQYFIHLTHLPLVPHICVSDISDALHWRHNDHDGVSNTSLTVVYLTVYSDVDQRKHQSSASLAFVWGSHRDRWIPRTKSQLRGKCFHLMTSSWRACYVDISGFRDV